MKKLVLLFTSILLFACTPEEITDTYTPNTPDTFVPEWLHGEWESELSEGDNLMIWHFVITETREYGKTLESYDAYNSTVIIKNQNQFKINNERKGIRDFKNLGGNKIALDGEIFFKK